MGVQHRKLSELKLTEQAQPREKIDLETVAEYAEALQDPKKELPPVVVFGAFVADGFHRYLAYQSADRKTIPTLSHPGGLREATLYSCGANAIHGLRRTTADKQRAVKKMLSDEQWAQWGARRIADHCQVHHSTVIDLQSSVGIRRIPDEIQVKRGTQEYTLKPPPKPKVNRDPSVKRILSAITLLAKSDGGKFMAGLSEPQRERLLGGNPSELQKARQFLDSL